MTLIPTDFFGRLQKKYENDANLKESWKYEQPILEKIIEQVAEKLSFNYEFVEPLGVGGSGVVAVVYDKNLDTKRAVKISRPSEGKEKLLARILSGEAESLKRLSHTNLIKIFAQGVISLGGDDYPYYVMEYLEKVKDSDKYLGEEAKTQEDVLKVFDGVISAVKYLHDQDTIHMDLKPENIFVTVDGTPIIIDLGFAKHLKVGNTHTLIGGTDGYIHPDARKLVSEAKTDPNRLRGEAARDVLKEYGKVWDLYSLGKTFLKLLRVLDENNSKTLSPYTRRFLRLLSCRLLDGYNTHEERAIGLSVNTIREIKYTNATQVKVDIDKLTGIYNLAVRIPELNLHIQDTIQASTLAITPFTERVAKLLAHPSFMRLGNCTQLGLLNLIYPTATHTRLEHTIGAFSVLCRFILALYNDPLNPLFCQIMNEEDLRAALLSALLHDIGQYSLAHDLEEASHSFFSHETLGLSILRDTSSSLRSLIESPNDWYVPTERIIDILKAKPASLSGNLKDRILRSLINGPIDADKIDYLMRDSQVLGLNYGKAIDFERLLRCLTIVCEEKAGGQTYAALGIHEKGKIPSEAIAFARYAMFGQVYWHHAYRAIKAMIHRMIWDMLSKYKGKTETVERNINRLRSNFRNFIIPPTVTALPEQPILTGMTSYLEELSRIQKGDLAVLRWIANESSDSGKEFLEMLESRNLFKRVLVLSHDRAEDKVLWEKMTRFYRENDWRKKHKLQTIFQEKIVGLVETPPEAPPHTDVITDDAKNRFITDGKRKVVLLIDLPPVRKGTDIPLRYLVEEDRRRIKIDEMQVGTFEPSVVWNALQENFQESIGKLRVFCHPDHNEFLTAYLSRRIIEDALSNALESTFDSDSED